MTSLDFSFISLSFLKFTGYPLGVSCPGPEILIHPNRSILLLLFLPWLISLGLRSSHSSTWTSGASSQKQCNRITWALVFQGWWRPSPQARATLSSVLRWDSLLSMPSTALSIAYAPRRSWVWSPDTCQELLPICSCRCWKSAHTTCFPPWSL